MIPETTSRSSGPAPVTWSIIALNVLVGFLEIVGGEDFIVRWAFVPAELDDLLTGDGGVFVLVTMFTAMFLHGSLSHLLGNMLFLAVFGPAIEGSFGARRYLSFYIGCGFVANITQFVADRTSDVPNLGASGAIAGVMGAFLALFPRARIELFVWPLSLLFRRGLLVPAWLMLGGWFLGQLVSAQAAQYGADDGGVAFFAHIGGFATGFLLARPTMAYLDRRSGRARVRR